MNKEKIMKYQKIGIFDSGLGGTTVLKELIKELPHEKILYYGDSGNAPYGVGKTKEEIQILCENIVKFFIRNECKIILVACNTAVVAALDYLKERYKTIPIIGIVESGVELALENTKNGKIGVFSTKFTKDSNAYKNEIIKTDERCSVTQVACIEFAEMIEKGWENYPNREKLLEKYISELPNDVDTLILGCTHYPLIKEEIKEIFKSNILDPALKMVQNTKKKLEELELLNDDNILKEPTFFITGELENFIPTAQKFLGKKIEVYAI